MQYNIIQDIIVLTIVFSAIVYLVISIVKTLKKKTSPGCNCDFACSAKSDIKRAIQKKQHSLHKIQTKAVPFSDLKI